MTPHGSRNWRLSDVKASCVLLLLSQLPGTLQTRLYATEGVSAALKAKETRYESVGAVESFEGGTVRQLAHTVRRLHASAAQLYRNQIGTYCSSKIGAGTSAMQHALMMASTLLELLTQFLYITINLYSYR